MFMKKNILLRLFLLLCLGGLLTTQPEKSVSAANSAVYLPLVLQSSAPSFQFTILDRDRCSSPNYSYRNGGV